MVHPLIGIHAALGELALFCWIWILVEFLNPTPQRVNRARVAAVISIVSLLLSWMAGGFYYVTIYGPQVKPLIKAGPEPWAHAVIMELKEHVFLFLPFLVVLAGVLVWNASPTDLTRRKIILILAILILVVGFSMAGMGYMISSAARASLEAKI